MRCETRAGDAVPARRSVTRLWRAIRDRDDEKRGPTHATTMARSLHTHPGRGYPFAAHGNRPRCTLGPSSLTDDAADAHRRIRLGDGATKNAKRDSSCRRLQMVAIAQLPPRTISPQRVDYCIAPLVDSPSRSSTVRNKQLQAVTRPTISIRLSSAAYDSVQRREE